MAQAIESGIGALNYGKQGAKGTIATAAGVGVGTNQPKLRSGVLKSGKKLGNEEYVDGQRFGSPAMYTDAVGGQVGDLLIQAQPENAGLFYAQILGVDTVTGAADPYTHTITSAGTAGAWGTWWQKVGAAVGPQREVYFDSKIAKFVDECGADQKVMHFTMSIMALMAARVFTVDAAKTQDASDPYVWPEMTGSCSFDGTTIGDVSGEVIEIDTQMEAWWGDSIAPAQLIEKKGTIIRTIKSIATDVSLLKYNKAIWNATAPVAGTDPDKAVFYANAQTVYTRSATRTLTKTTPKMAVNPENLAIGPQSDGGAIPIEFTGLCLKSGATAALTVVALSADATSY